MAETLPAPVEARKTSASGHAALFANLDHLLEQYLELLDAYTAARAELSAQLSSGYLALARANFNARSHGRYGQDYYDERMKASRKVNIVEDDGKISYQVTHTTLSDPPSEPFDEKPTKLVDNSGDFPEEKGEGPGDLGISDLSLGEERGTPEHKAPSATGDSAEPSNPMDPIKWFGILVPQSLRTAQSQFSKAVDGPVPQLCKIIQEMRQLEIEIGRARKAIRKAEGIHGRTGGGV